MNDRKYTGGLKATEKDLEYLSYIQSLMGVSRAKAIRIAIEKMYNSQKEDINRKEVHFYYGDSLKYKIEYLENKLNLSKSNIYRLAIREF
ncbi:MAG: hypothetical protein PUG84_01505 [Peptoniphilaceae bacterium]|nr:hypothetical protein [Peptoniphilaceae bacterium]